jgi:hypothetical protein
VGSRSHSTARAVTVAAVEHFIVDSCHSRWVFDTERRLFRRVLTGPGLGLRTVMTEWRPYAELHLDEHSDSFTVVLNQDGTRMLRSWRHRDRECVQCGSGTKELSVEDIAQVENR